MQTKTCTKCGETKELGAFGKNKAKKDDHNNDCKVCRSEYDAAYAAAHRDRKLASLRRFEKKNPTYKTNHKREYKARERDELRPAYVARILGISLASLTPDLLALKREQLLNLRVLKALTSTLKDLDHGK